MFPIHVRPNSFCVYAHYVLDVCIYVGMGSYSRAFSKHKRSKNWITLTENGYDVVIMHVFVSRKEAECCECELIKSIKPVCNLFHFPGWIPPHFIGNTWNSGRKHSVETRAKLSVSQKESWKKTKRKTGTRKPVKPIRCVNTGIVYKGLREAARALDMSPSAISQCINGNRLSAGGLKFVREA